MTMPASIIRFPQGAFEELRLRLLHDNSNEAFALILGKRTTAGGHSVVRVKEVIYPGPADYEGQSIASLRLRRGFVYDQLVRMQQSGDVDTVVDVHTHPFCSDGVAFSSVDDRDEENFHRWLTETLEDVHYASIVLSQSDYAARTWETGTFRSVHSTAQIKTQTVAETRPCSDDDLCESESREIADIQAGFLARSALALGLDTLRQVMTGQTIAIIGVGGLGSVIAENLIHTGFQSIHLIDPDRVEITNLNRIVGAYFSDVEENRFKVDVVKQHLQRINPNARVEGNTIGIEDGAALPVLLQCDWMIVATDNHASRYHAQRIALDLALPLISAGVNITVEDQQVADMSGEVIIARSGDHLCLNCLGRINPTYVAAEEHKGAFIGDELIRRGYVTGEEVKEPAVKTLNAIVGAMAVEVLLNQYTQRQLHVPVLVYENNRGMSIFPDHDSVDRRNQDCYFCA